jgi:flagellar protein FlaH
MLEIQLSGDEFHKKVGGGIPTGSLVMIKGENSSGKSVICQRIAYGLLNSRTPVTFISTQLTTVDFINQMNSLGYRVSQHLINGLILFIPVYPLISEPKSRDDFVDKLMKAQSLFEHDAIFIDSLSSLIKQEINEEKAVDLLAFMKRITGTGKVVIFTVNSGELPREIEKELEFAATILIETKVKEFGGDLKNIMIIKKYNRAQGNYQKITTFRVEPKIGLVVEIAAVS